MTKLTTKIVDVLDLTINNKRYLIKRNSKKHFYSIFDEDDLYLGYIFFNNKNYLLNSPLKNFNCSLEFETFYDAFDFLIEKAKTI
ncbi:hypothetical protein [Arcobacter porcinus]|uniref:Uncharacterized protein n=1 Tax=Arcobacter porcinus TaxID=1935204 RepID=A0A5C2HD51_9BACT|nr:hypothetical protein [Arcobacter porcinus]OCL91377.1 hypothetical protein AAX27_01324 [Aliarcobacter thereius]QEP40305.1 hypothetical protein APORC_0690 [Arcobacter porcinus]